MKRTGFLMFALTLTALLPMAASAHTILIDTWETDLPENMDLESRTRVVSAETGIMDLLFDEGHIFFNTYSVPTEGGVMPDFSVSVDLAGRIGAEYLIRLDPTEQGVAWKLYEVRDVSLLNEGYQSIDEVDSTLKSIERWTELGLIIARVMIGEMS